MAAQINTTTFDQNDPKYQTCCGALHIKLAARIVSVIYIVVAVGQVIFASARGLSLALYSWISFACSIAIFGCLVYGVFKEKRVYLLPYLLFQVAGIVLSALALIVFIILTAVSPMAVYKFAADYGGVNLDDTPENVAAAVHTVMIIAIILLCITLLFEILFFETIYRFKEFLHNRENSFSFNLEGVFQTANSVYSTNMDDLDVITSPQNTLK